MKRTVLQPFDWFLIAGILVTTMLYSILVADIRLSVHSADWWITSICSIVNILCVVLSAKGSRLNFLFGIIYNILYAIYCIRTGHLGNAAVYGVFFLAMQFVGYAQWRKIGTRGDGEQVAARRLSVRGILSVSVISVAAVAAVYFILRALGGNDVVFDALVTVVCIIAQVLLTFAYVEQWYLWILVNILTIVMWAISSFKGHGTGYDAIMVINYSFTLINSVNGLRFWYKLSRQTI